MTYYRKFATGCFQTAMQREELLELDASLIEFSSQRSRVRLKLPRSNFRESVSWRVTPIPVDFI